LVAEIVMINKILQEGGKTIYLVPLKALAEEKYKEFKFWEKLGIRVTMTTGDYDSTEEWLGKYDIIIATSEKFDSLLRHKSPWIKDINLVIADEIHLLGSYDRGATLEMILAHLGDKAQILGLSATVGNAGEVAEWLNADLVMSEWRPVALRKGVFYHGELFWEDGGIEKFPTQWNSLVIDALKKGKQVLVFVNTRRSAEKEALLLAEKIQRFLTKPEERKLKHLADGLDTTPTNEKLKEALTKGVAFHHAGLGRTERSIIEDAFREGLIKVITATPTLSAGVNLPAYRVIIRDTKRYSNFGWVDIPVLEIQQMMGRAGRPKYDREGQAIIIAKTKKPEDLMKRYVLGKPEKLFSMLSNEASFRSQILALITNFGVGNFKELITFLERTFYYHQRKNLEALEGKAKSIVYFLFENGFIDIDLNDQFMPLPLGIRTSQLYLDPVTAKKFKDAFEKLEKNPNPLGVFQLLTSTPDMSSLRVRRKEQEDLLDYAYEMEEYLYQNIPYWEDYKFEKFLREMKTAKLLLDWINEVNDVKILETYEIDTGDLYRILELVDWLMYSLIELYKLFDPKPEVLDFLKKLHIRVKHGVREELLELITLPMIGRKRARALYNAGFKGIDDIVRAKASELLKVEGIGVGVLEKIYQHFGVELPTNDKKKKVKKGTLDEFFK
ncbi:ATP-dependent DNA helicase, partial [Thermococci archaeon]